MDDNSAVALIQIEDDLAACHLEAVAAAVAESQRPSTRKAYTAAWKRFQAWAKREGARSLPAAPVTVAAYLVHRDAVGLSLASLAMDRKAIQLLPSQGRAPDADCLRRRQDGDCRREEPRRPSAEGPSEGRLAGSGKRS